MPKYIWPLRGSDKDQGLLLPTHSIVMIIKWGNR